MSRSVPTPLERFLEFSLGDDISPDAQEFEAAMLPLQGPAEDAPSADLWDRILTKIAHENAAPGTDTIIPAEGVWERVAPGIERKVLHVDSAAELMSYFVRMHAGSVLPGHDHGADEHCVVLRGELEIGGSVFGEGTYHFARDGIPHVPITARTDALLFLHGAL